MKHFSIDLKKGGYFDEGTNRTYRERFSVIRSRSDCRPIRQKSAMVVCNIFLRSDYLLNWNKSLTKIIQRINLFVLTP